ncbi:MAG: Holliday junction resolvase RuvX, partial [Rhodanobacteraceae bacterium]
AAHRFAGLRAAGLQRRRGVANLDSVAAAIILESWLTQV